MTFSAVAWTRDFNSRLLAVSRLDVLEGSMASNFSDDCRSTTFVTQEVLVDCFNGWIRSEGSIFNLSGGRVLSRIHSGLDIATWVGSWNVLVEETQSIAAY